MAPEQPHEPGLARNPLSLIGAALTTVSAVTFLNYLALEAFGLLESPYSGLFGFVALPFLFVLGLLLIALGILREARRRQLGHPAWRWPTIDLQNTRTRSAALVVLALTVINVSILAVAAVGVVEYSESNQFCGEACHTAMEPQYVAYQYSPHARVTCVSCHVRAGAVGMIDAKLNGTRQLYHVAAGSYPRPISPARDRTSSPAEACETCHSPIAPSRDVTRVYPEYNSDAASSLSGVTTLSMNAEAYHWHMRPDVVVEFMASDGTLEEIPYIRATVDGETTEYLSREFDSPPEGALRRMDCLDCHNRPAHQLTDSPEQIVDRAIASGTIDTSLPFTRRELISALTEVYPSQTTARDGIARQLAEALGTGPIVVDLVAFAQQSYATNVFPSMNVEWSTYSSMLSHEGGCFRCHDNAHEATGVADLRSVRVPVIRRNCQLCHSVR